MAIGNTIVELQLKKAKLLSEVIAWVECFDNATKEQIIDWIQNDQLKAKGVDKFGDIIGFYSYATELASNGRKQQGQPYDLFDTGDFYKSMRVIVTTHLIEINADPKKGNDDLFKKYGTGIIGLTDENFQKLKAKVKQGYIDHARKILFGSK